MIVTLLLSLFHEENFQANVKLKHRMGLGNLHICYSQFFTSGNFSFYFALTALAYITIPKNKRKTKIT